MGTRLNHSAKTYYTILFLIIFVFSTMQSVEAKKLNAFLSYTTFYSPEKGPFVETYLSVMGNSVEFIKNENDKYQATIQVILLFKKGEEIANYDKYELFSPELDDTTSVNFNFIDQQRYSLPEGNYDFEIQIWDKHTESKPYISLQPLEIMYPKDEVSISGIQLVESYEETVNPGILTKGGYDLIPYIVNYYPENVNKLTYYGEVYNIEKKVGSENQYLLTSYLTKMEKDKPLSSYISYKRQKAESVNVIFSEFDITNLSSGNYFLAIEARDRENKLLAKNRIFFQRSNPRMSLTMDDYATMYIENTFAHKISNLDTLVNYIDCLEPIADDPEKSFTMAHLKESDTETLQKFFYKFWYDRNQLEPELEWSNYLGEVNKVNLAYSTMISKGYETDRGRVYLKYGPPNAISESYNEPATYPYEIWHYYALENGQRNKKFIFYTKDIVTNDFVLLHSDVSGELSNYRWQYVLYQRVDPGFDIDRGAGDDSWGGNSKKYFDLPR